jgi:hypothetical protein
MSSSDRVLLAKRLSFDIVVCGGGMGGVCAALAAARNGMKTALIHNRSVLGGNASSEVRVHIGGAPFHGYHYDARETGIIEELRLDTAVRDPLNTYVWIDTVLYTACKREPNLSIFLNTNTDAVEMDGTRIKAINGVQSGSETVFWFEGKIFIDGTGDGTIGYLAGAEYRIGREARNEFNEPHAPEIADTHTMGASILFRAEDMGYPVPFDPVDWGYPVTREGERAHRGVGKDRNHGKYWHSDTVGWWWVEYGGMIDSIHDNEAIRDKLQSIVFGIWDYIKNHNPKTKDQAKNYALTWIGAVPGKRESRRLIGDHILTEPEVAAMTIFPDQIAVGGWSMDLHPPEGYFAAGPGAVHTRMDLPYSIPYRSIYSKNVENLFLGSRCISASHVAFGSTRLIATIALMGQACGTAATMCIQNNITPRVLGQQLISALQQQLLKADQWLLGLKNADPHDLALHATIRASSELPCDFGNPEKFVPLYFPIAQRFYLPPHSQSTVPRVFLYLSNPADVSQTYHGGIRRDPDRFEFASTVDLITFQCEIPAQFNGWVEIHPISPTSVFNFSAGGCYWLYLLSNDDSTVPEVQWGLNLWQYPGFRMGYYDEDADRWKTSRGSHDGMQGIQLGSRGHLCFKIEGVPSPYPASSVNNGEARPFYGPNLWVSAPIRPTQLKDPTAIINALPLADPEWIELTLPMPESIREFHFKFDTDLNNSYPHTDYGEMRVNDWSIGGKAPCCIRSFSIEGMRMGVGDWTELSRTQDNYQRFVVVKLSAAFTSDKFRIKLYRNWGGRTMNLYEIRLYSQKTL